MYGKTSKSQHYLPRTGSYSTVPHKNGRVDVLPPTATAALYNESKQQRVALKGKVHEAQAAMTALNEERQRLEPMYREWSREVKKLRDIGGKFIQKPPRMLDFERRRKEAQLRLSALTNDLQKLNKVTNLKELSTLSKLEIFRLVAEQMLDSETLERIKAEVTKRFDLSRSTHTSRDG